VSFHLGKPIFVMLLIALATSVVVSTRRPPARADMTMWVFAISHANSYRLRDRGPSLVDEYERKFGQTLNVNLINNRALDTRLLSLMMSGATGDKVPDVVELEINSVGKYFRFPPEKVGLLPLDEFLNASGLREELIAARLAPWTRDGTLFGIPHDVHPVTLTYRKDLFDAAGVDLAACETWDAFSEACLRYQAYWRANGHPERVAMEMSPWASDPLLRLILQRRVNLVDNHLVSHMTDPKVADTVVRYATMVAGSRRIGAAASPGGNNWVQDLSTGALGAMVTADWRVTYIRKNGPESLQGRLAMMPLPRFDPTDHPTSTWGGTMLGIPRNARDPAASWRVIEHILFSAEGIAARKRYTDIISPVRRSWEDPDLVQPDPLYGGQRVGRMFIELAPQVPEYHATPFSSFAATLLTEVLRQQVLLVDAGASETERREAAARHLRDADQYLKRIIAFSAFTQSNVAGEPTDVHE